MPDAPRLDSVSPGSATAGAGLTLTGAFGARTDASTVRFRVPVDGAAPVSGTVDDWSDVTIHVHVPSLSSFGSGGPLEITVHTDAGDSAAVPFLIEEESPPGIAGLDPQRGLQNDAVTITGQGFGRSSAGSAVLFQVPGASDVPAQVTSWSPGSIEVHVPSLAALGGAGHRGIVVRAPWGDSPASDFELGELPQVTAVVPASPMPGDTITVQGRAFGPQAGGSVQLVDPKDSNHVTHLVGAAIVFWSDTEIRVRLPELIGLRTTGPRDVVVTSQWGPSVPDQPAGILIGNRASITAWTRLEPHARTEDLQQGLRLGLQAQVYDALWLLGRQWQLLELRGADAGSPVSVSVNGVATPLARWRPYSGQPADVPAGVPLEALVERERVVPPLGTGTGPFDDLRLAAEAGLHLLRLIEANLHDKSRIDDYRARFLREYPIEMPADVASLDARTRRFLAVTAGRAPDGGRVYADFQTVLGSHPTLPKKPPIDGNDRAAVLAAVQQWYAWCADLISEPVGDAFGWDRQRMEYAFSTGSGDLVLAAPQHDGGHLDWYSFVRRAPGADTSLGEPATGRGPVAFTRTVVPNPVSFPGMPVPRWWELEDGRVDFGSVAAAPNELLTLVLVEFATVYGNDWFTLPLDALPVGALCELASVTVTDAFGVATEVAPFADGHGGDWRMFELAHEDGTADNGSALLLLDALPATHESSPVEEIVLLRDELANLAWAVEKTVESCTGRPVDRHEDEVSRRSQATPTGDELRRYVLQTPVPRQWIPLLPKYDRDGTGAVAMRWLARAAMRDPADGTPIPPRGRLLEPGTALDIYDEEVPRAGVRVSRLWTLGRASDGRTHLWRGRRKGPGRGEGSSGLRFDQATVPEV